MFTAAGWWGQFWANFLSDLIVGVIVGGIVSYSVWRISHAAERAKIRKIALGLLEREMEHNKSEATDAMDKMAEGALTWPAFLCEAWNLVCGSGALADLEPDVSHEICRAYAQQTAFDTKLQVMWTAPCKHPALLRGNRQERRR